jgi:hypothetical protein
MNIFKISSNLIGPVHHGTDFDFNEFNIDKSAQGILWFTEDKNKLLKGDAGIGYPKYIIAAMLNVENTAGWDEYEKLMMEQIQTQGFDSIKLDDDWAIFDPQKVKIISKEKL